jgi:hypothetical protein
MARMLEVVKSRINQVSKVTIVEISRSFGVFFVDGTDSTGE